MKDASTRFMNIVECVEHHAATVPNRLAVASEDGALTYLELRVRVDDLAGALIDMGVKKGDVVACLSYPRIDAYTLHLAVISIGAIFVGINPKYKLPEMSYIVEDAQPVALFFVPEMEGRDYGNEVAALESTSDCVKHLVSFDKPVPGARLLRELVTERGGKDASQRPDGALSGEDACMIVYTSGSSGKPKGCLLRNGSMVHRGQMQIRGFDFSGEYPIILNPLPMNHIGALQLICGYAMVSGGTAVFTRRFDAETLGPTVARHEINTLIMVPTMIHLMFSAEGFDPADYASVELFMFAGGSISIDYIRKLQKLGRGKVQTNYGLSEGHSTVLISTPGLDVESLSKTLGRSQDGEARVVDDAGQTCTAVGEQGELQIKREFCMRGYLNRPEATQAVFTEDGWLKTGDKVELTEHDEMRLVGRMSEMYKSGGYNIYPREIEMCLEEHPDVGIAAVIERTDELFGEVGVAYVVPESDAEPTQDELKAWCKRSIADYKVPKEFFARQALPLLPNNKIDKLALRRELANETST
jgi:acyl-CoA synthetase (AMP-forming)/AMP-acid ligase II